MSKMKLVTISLVALMISSVAFADHCHEGDVDQDRVNADTANVWIQWKVDRHGNASPHVRPAFNVEDYDMDLFADGHNYCNSDRIRKDHWYEMGCHRTETPSAIQSMYLDVNDVFFDCYKQESNPTMWACFVVEEDE